MDDSQSTAAPALIGCQGLEQYLLLVKTARGSAAVDLIQRVLEAPGVYVFGELLEEESVRDLDSGPHAHYIRLLELFAYGTYKDYKSKGTAHSMCVFHLTEVVLYCSTIRLTTEVESGPAKEAKALDDCFTSC